MKRFIRPAFVLFLLVSLAGLSEAQIAASNRQPAAVRSSVIDAPALLADIKLLSSDEFEGRSPRQASILKTREFVVKRFRESGLAPFGTGYDQEFLFTPRQSTESVRGINYIGLIRGRKHPDKYIVITAHYDHDGIRNGQIYNGADDNASGTAALFALAKAFSKKKPDNSLLFVAFDAEELGLRGSRHFVANLPVPKESILLNVNLDMLARNEKGELYAAGAFHHPWLKPVLEKVQKKARVKLLLGHDDPRLGRDDWTYQSDQGSFHAAKIPFVYFGVEDHADYHKPTDDFERIMPEFYVRAVETVLAAIKVLDKD